MTPYEEQLLVDAAAALGTAASLINHHSSAGIRGMFSEGNDSRIRSDMASLAGLVDPALAGKMYTAYADALKGKPTEVKADAPKATPKSAVINRAEFEKDPLSPLGKMVAHGAAYMDEHRPGWADEINTDRFDIGNGDWCIIAQTFGKDRPDWSLSKNKYEYGKKQMPHPLSDMYSFGFIVGSSNTWIADDLWRRAILARLAG